jgi:hypothetical protein
MALGAMEHGYFKKWPNPNGPMINEKRELKKWLKLMLMVC